MNFEPPDDNYAVKIRESFARQSVMNLIGAELVKVAPGEVDIKLFYRNDLTQQQGFLHAGITATIGDSACGYAAFSLMPAGAEVVTSEYKINLLSPALGDYFLAAGRVLKAGKLITVARADIYADKAGRRKLIATMLATSVGVQPRR
jgi:uncharacterized protein (TIGR00369 family)